MGKVSCTSASPYTIIIMPTQFWMFTQLYKLRKISFIQCDHIKHQAINWAMKEERGSTAQFEHIYPPAEKRSGNNFPFPEEFEISTQNQRKSYSWKPSGDETQKGEGKLHWMTKNGRIYFKSLWGFGFRQDANFSQQQLLEIYFRNRWLRPFRKLSKRRRSEVLARIYPG